MGTAVDVGDPTTPDGVHGRRPGAAFALKVFLVVLVLTGVVVAVSGRNFGLGEGEPHQLSHFDRELGPWSQFDAGWYATLADHGYDAEQVARYDRHDESGAAFFPAYPLLVRWTEPLTGGDPYLAEIVDTVVCGAVLAVLFVAWCRRREQPRATRIALLALLLFPYGYYVLAAPYNDAMFLAAAIGAFLLVELDRPIAAGLVGALATATRPVGFGLIAGLVIVVLERRGALHHVRRPRELLARMRRRDAGVLLSAVGVGAFMVFLWSRFGSPIAYSIAQRGWDQAFGLRTVLKYNFFDHVLHDPNPWFVVRLVVQAALVIVFLAAVPQVWRRYGAGYGCYSLIVLALPTIGNGTFISVGRYVLAAFPMFALAGAWLAERSPRVVTSVLATSALGMAVVASFYGRSYFMS